MSHHFPRRAVHHAIATLALATLFAAVGAGGWFVAHIATYDAVSAHPQGAHASHGYMQPLGTLSVLGIAVGLLCTALALLVTRRALVRGVLRLHERNSVAPWLLAAALPAASFVAVELVEGSGSTLGPAGILLGVALQALLGIGAFALVQLLVLGLARAVERLVGTPARPAPMRERRSLRCRRDVPRPRRRRPMADNAARRGPPTLVDPPCSMA